MQNQHLLGRHTVKGIPILVGGWGGQGERVGIYTDL